MSLVQRLKNEIAVIKERDPAIHSSLEVLLYPSFKVMVQYRLAHRLYEKGHFFLARWISQRAARKTGIEIHPGATIGKGFFIDHGNGVVIGETTQIGDNVTLYQGVTLGGTGKESGKRHPTLCDNVMVSAGAKILGSFTIGANSKIGAGSVVLEEVPPNSTVVGVPGHVVKRGDVSIPRETLDQTDLPDPVQEDITLLKKENTELTSRLLILEDKVRRLQREPIDEKKVLDGMKGRMPMFDVEKTKDGCVKWIRDFFEENGKGCNAVLGISGGKDSSVAAALCVEALGADRVIGVLMPNGQQADIDMAQLLCSHLGIRNYTVNIKDAVDGIKNAVPFELSSQSEINLPPRIRMATVYAVSQTNNGRVVNTCNLSEDWVGYSTRYGDAAGDFSPLAHLTVQEVKAVGRLLGLPDVLVDKTPADGLCGKTDEDNLGFAYAVLDRYIRTGQIDDEATKDLIDKKHRMNVFKLKPMPSFDPGIDVMADGADL